MYSVEMIDVFPDFSKSVSLAFSRKLFKQDFSNFCIIVSLLGGLPIYTRTDDIDLCSSLVHCGLNLYVSCMQQKDQAQYASCNWCVFKRHN